MCFLCDLCNVNSFVFSFQIAYRTAGNRFQGKLSELFLVLSDEYPAQLAQEGQAEAAGFQPSSRGQKHRLEDDQMSVQSVESKRLDTETSAEKNRKKQQQKSGKSKPKN